MKYFVKGGFVMDRSNSCMFLSAAVVMCKENATKLLITSERLPLYVLESK